MVDCSGAVQRVSAWTLFKAFVFIVSYTFGYTLGKHDGPCSKFEAGRNHDIDGIHNNHLSFDIWIDHCSLLDYDDELIDITVSSNMVIDATNKGNKSRFINHSCEPNTEMQKSTVDGETRVGMFALLDMERGEELTYDYKYVQFGADHNCHWGSSNCRKMVGMSRKTGLLAGGDLLFLLIFSVIGRLSHGLPVLLSKKIRMH